MEKRAIKLIAADMDGTLLDSKGRLNPEFFSVFESLKEKGVMFVAASGRQYYNLLKLFNRVKDDIMFVAENGTYVVFRSQELLVVDIPVNEAHKVIREVRGIEGAFPVLCGKGKAYIENDMPEFVKQARTYYERCDLVPDLLEITDDRFLKIAVYDFGGSSINSYPVLQHFNDSLKVVVSGQNWLDVSHQEANKGNALIFLQNYMSVKADECMAFGDQMNDAEMLQAVSNSFAMANSAEELKCFARYIAPSNDENGVLRTIRNFILNNATMDIRTKITGIQHVGVPTDDIQKSILFYKGLGFGIVWQTINEQDGTSVVFLQLGNLIMEVYENKQASMKSGAIDHIALNVTDIDAVFSKIKELGYEMLDDNIRFLPFWEYGVRFFTIIGPNKEKIEFCEKQITAK